MTIGSAQDNDLVLPDPFVSKHHCSIQRRSSSFWIEDDRSLNGTWVENVRVQTCELRPGARIILGKTALEVVGRTNDESRFGLVGHAPPMLEVHRQIERLGSSRCPVLILGETGTGKELVARAIHDASACHLGPFEVVNCSAISTGLAESLLFGHERGAFTGAERAHAGAFERADGGTLFLDELGELPLQLQPKLLRVLEQAVVERVGSETRRPIQVRVVAATHRQLQAEVERGGFRADLFHRLAVGVMRLPALRERTSDIPLLLEHFLHASDQVGRTCTVRDDVVPFLVRQQWPGNVRQLRNAIHQAAILGGPELTVDDFVNIYSLAIGETSGQDKICFVGRPFRDIRREIYLKTLQAHGGNRAEAAMALGVPKSTFADQVRAMGL
jgi:DNA-binding NtrC family response regulator